jgi:small subunit ribosomal protein S6
MPLYECVFIARNDVSQQQVDIIADSLTTLITEHGGEVKKREYWGLRGLAYKVKKNRKGHYMLLGIDAPAPAIHELERQLGLNEDVLREMTTRIEELNIEEPSAILAKRGEDRDRERGFRGPKPAGRFGSGRGRERGDEREEFRARPRDDMDLNGMDDER